MSLTPCFRGMVNSWEADEMGHMNVRFYVQKALQATGHFLNEIGLGPNFRREKGLGIRIMDHHIRFLKEARPGTPLVIMTGALGADEAGLFVLHEVRHALTGDVCATLTGTVVLTDGLGDQPFSLPEEAAEQARGFATDLPDYAAQRGIDAPGPKLVPNWGRADEMGLHEITRIEVRPHLLDPDGALSAEHFIGAISDGIPTLISQFAVNRQSSLERGIGGAALEYRLFYIRRIFAGELITVRSGLSAIGNKTFTHIHWMFDQNRNVVASAAAVAVSFDLKERKAIAFSDEARAQFENYLVPGLGI